MEVNASPILQVVWEIVGETNNDLVTPIWIFIHSMMRTSFGLQLLLLGFAVSAKHISSRSSPSESYSLYAFGDSIGGFPMYYADGDAVVGNKAPWNATNVGQVSFTPGESGPMVGNPASNSTGANGTSQPAFQNQQCFVRRPDSSDHQVGFTQNATSNQVPSNFIWYGHFLLVENDGGEYTSRFYVKKTEQEDVFNITDDDDEDDFILISMRGLPPHNA
ncbi:hypothetical protein N7481_007523 [Penicillium waksmanii]|uniref:uncharacterized protein n=1 Tax=Penicillium waksmanii TaxID=69791 RepID=UPI00254711C9|nr:uncharacterized protein N7481_007523 [Penicillium waksmanii]KAJ5980225.1 hypothetical protein N7481_007523 [Penicillium waksmanii]